MIISWAWAAPDIQTPEGRSQERTRLDLERETLEKQFNAADLECQTRFVVTACRDDVKLKRTRAMDELTRQENILSTMERREAAAKRLQKLDDKVSEDSQADKERKRQEALENSAKRVTDREEKILEKERKAASTEASKKAESKEKNKAATATELERAAKRAAYAAKQEELAKRLKRRDEGLVEVAEKQKERDREAARKTEKYSKALKAEAAAKEAASQSANKTTEP